MIWRIKNIFWNIKRVIRWIPIVWKDREYDDSFFLRIISFKLKLMEEFYRSKYAVSADRKDCATKIHLCKLFCDRLIEDNYDSMLDKEYHQKDFESFITAINNDDKTITCHTIGWLDNRWHKYKDYMARQDLKYLCEIIQKRLFSWWD